MKAILVVDDRDDCRLTTKWFLGSFGYSIETARSAEEALLLFDPKVHDAVITDNSMPAMSGSEMAHIIKLRSPTTPVLMYSGNPPADQSCLDLVLQRPTHLSVLKEALDQLLLGATRAGGPASSGGSLV
jgi:CheY-like chemotaxis protein